MMTSFSLKQCILFAEENHSKAYVCFLDTKQAFDRVWHNGLLVKLIEIGISNQLIKTYINMYRLMVSRVSDGSVLSNTIQLQQGTRQGGKRAPILYLLFINGLNVTNM